MTLNVSKGKKGFQETKKAEPSALPLGDQDLGDEAGVVTTTQNTYVDPYPGRKGNERVSGVCGKCAGTGIYSAPTGYTDNRGKPYCFDCHGTGKRSFLVSSARQTAKRRIKADAKAAERSSASLHRAAAEAKLAEAIPGFAEAFAAVIESDDHYSDESIAHQAAWDALIRLRYYGDIDEAIDSFDYSTRRRYLPKLISANKWAKPCVVCDKRVKAGEGVLGVRDAKWVGDVWETYCEEHIPADAVDARRT